MATHRTSALTAALALLHGSAGNVVVVPRRQPVAGPPGLRALMLYDCQADFLDMMRGWSEEKRAWCCSRSGINCKLATSRQSKAVVVNEAFSCEEGFHSWRAEWSVGKKAWCCHSVGKGCPATLRGLLQGRFSTANSQVDSSASSKPDRIFWEHDCKADVGDWSRAWPVHKKRWCCKLSNEGCPESQASSKDAEAAFDCDAALANWRVDWSDAKKDWCCEHKSRACIAHDCAADLDDWVRAWSVSKKTWCCMKEGHGCAAVGTATSTEMALTQEDLEKPFDCQASEAAWQTEWSDFKMQFCCKKTGRGCMKVPSAALAAEHAVASAPAVPLAVLPAMADEYDCAADTASWVQSWSDAKRDYCCSRKPHGCKVPKKLMLAANFDYDCQAALKSFKREWSEKKKDWCCNNADLGCEPISV